MPSRIYAPNLATTDPGGKLKARIERLINGHAGVTVASFVRDAIEERCDMMEDAERKIEIERANRIKVSGEICPNKLDEFALQRAREVITRRV